MAEPNEKNQYSGHRQRMRQRFMKNGFDGQPHYAVLELLLTYAIPQRDVQPLARTLIQHFGSLSAVLDASVEELCQVKGISENTAVLITLIPELARLYGMDKWGDKPKIETADKAAEYAKGLYTGEVYEVFYMISLDSQCRVLHTDKISEGTLDQSAVYIRNLVELAFRRKAYSVMISHNHPGGNPKPSSADIAMTKGILEGMGVLNIKLLDHIIVAGEKIFCFSREGLLRSMYSAAAEKKIAEAQT